MVERVWRGGRQPQGFRNRAGAPASATVAGAANACPARPARPQAPLVGSQAPDFTATAVFDQEFVDVKLSQYRVGGRVCVSVGGWARAQAAGRS